MLAALSVTMKDTLWGFSWLTSSICALIMAASAGAEGVMSPVSNQQHMRRCELPHNYTKSNHFEGDK
jgi:hypothetical protein